VIAKLTFPAEEVEKLPLPYVNALSIQSGIDDFFVTIGSVVPPEIKSQELLRNASLQKMMQTAEASQ
jgi:hypothetical protein